MIIILVLLIYCAYILQIKLYERFWDRRLDIKVTFQDKYIFADESAVLTETIINNKFLPLPLLQVAFSMDRNLEFQDMENAKVSDKCYKRDVFSILFYQKIERQLPFTSRKRGFYQINAIDLTAHDIFQNKYITTLPQNTMIYVYPKQLDVHNIQIPYRRLMGILKNKKQLYEDPFEFRGIREYGFTDPMNTINWKASAKTGSLMVNTYDSTTSQKITLFLDLEDSINFYYEEVAETSISIAASLTGRLLADGITVDFISNGVDHVTKETIEIRGMSNKTQMNAVNRGLSRIDLKQNIQSIEPYLTQEEQIFRDDSLILLISMNQKPSMINACNKLRRKYSDILWIAPYYNSMDFDSLQTNQQTTASSLPNTANCPIIPWEVSR